MKVYSAKHGQPAVMENGGYRTLTTTGLVRLLNKHERRRANSEDLLDKAKFLLCDMAKLEVGDGTDMYTCTIDADEWLARVNLWMAEYCGGYNGR